MATKTIPPKRAPAKVMAFLSAYTPPVQDIASKARALVLNIVPDALGRLTCPPKCSPIEESVAQMKNNS